MSLSARITPEDATQKVKWISSDPAVVYVDGQRAGESDDICTAQTYDLTGLLTPGKHTIALMALVDIALMYEREKGKNDTAPYNDILTKLTSEIEEALK